MVTKTITITEEAYCRIKNLKRNNESFSELFTRLAESKFTVNDILGKFGHNEAEANKMRKRIKEYRKEFDKDAKKRQNKLTRQLNSH